MVQLGKMHKNECFYSRILLTAAPAGRTRSIGLEKLVNFLQNFFPSHAGNDGQKGVSRLQRCMPLQFSCRRFYTRLCGAG